MCGCGSRNRHKTKTKISFQINLQFCTHYFIINRKIVMIHIAGVRSKIFSEKIDSSS